MDTSLLGSSPLPFEEEKSRKTRWKFRLGFKLEPLGRSAKVTENDPESLLMYTYLNLLYK